MLVNNAAFCPTAPTAELPNDTFTYTLDVNMGGTFRYCRESVGRLQAIGRAGRIVNISSQAALRGSRSGKSAYDASKAGVIGRTISLSRELAAKGFRVNCVTPGLMLTEMIAAAVAKNPDEFNKRVPMGRLAQTREIADGVLYKIEFEEDGTPKPPVLFAQAPFMISADGIFFDRKREVIFVADSLANAVRMVFLDATVRTLAQDPENDGSDGRLDQPSETLVRGDELIVCNFDFPVPGGVNTKFDPPHTISVIKLPESLHDLAVCSACQRPGKRGFL